MGQVSCCIMKNILVHSSSIAHVLNRIRNPWGAILRKCNQRFIVKQFLFKQLVIQQLFAEHSITPHCTGITGCHSHVNIITNFYNNKLY